MCRSRFSYFRTPELGSPDQKYWPCKSNAVRLGSSPRAPERVGGLRAVGRGSDHRASHDSLLLCEWRTRTLPEGTRVGFELREGGMSPEAVNVLAFATKGSP